MPCSARRWFLLRNGFDEERTTSNEFSMVGVFRNPALTRAALSQQPHGLLCFWVTNHETRNTAFYRVLRTSYGEKCRLAGGGTRTRLLASWPESFTIRQSLLAPYPRETVAGSISASP